MLVEICIAVILVVHQSVDGLKMPIRSIFCKEIAKSTELFSHRDASNDLRLMPRPLSALKKVAPLGFILTLIGSTSAIQIANAACKDVYQHLGFDYHIVTIHSQPIERKLNCERKIPKRTLT